jgi:hypothetical protein
VVQLSDAALGNGLRGGGEVGDAGGGDAVGPLLGELAEMVTDEAAAGAGGGLGALLVTVSESAGLLETEVADEAGLDGDMVEGILGARPEGEGLVESGDVGEDLAGVFPVAPGGLPGRDESALGEEAQIGSLGGAAPPGRRPSAVCRASRLPGPRPLRSTRSAGAPGADR